MRTLPLTPPALGRQLTEWRQPLNEDLALEDAVMRLLDTVDRHLRQAEQAPETLRS